VSGIEPGFFVALRACREARGISARALSLQAGLSESMVGKIESGAEPGLRTFSQIVYALQLSRQEIAMLVLLASVKTKDK
jgi:transcriptional regulator with XRE-family HTH domain